MSDIIDDAALQISLNEERSIKYAQLEASKPIPTSEYCLWCDGKTSNGIRWCNASCRDAWQEFGSQ